MNRNIMAAVIRSSILSVHVYIYEMVASPINLNVFQLNWLFKNVKH